MARIPVFTHAPTYLEADSVMRAALIATALELKYRYGGTVWAEPNAPEYRVHVELDEDASLWMASQDRMRMWAQRSHIQRVLMSARYGTDIRVSIWAKGMNHSSGLMRIDECTSLDPDCKGTTPTPAYNVEESRKLLVSNISDVKYHIAIGCVFYVAGKIGMAKDAFRRALLLDEENAEAWMHLGNMYYVEQDYPQAMIYYRMALRLAPDYAKGWLALGNALCNMGQHKAGIVCFHKALTLDPDSAAALHNMGNALIGIRHFSEAEVALRKSLKLDPLQEKTYNTLGNVYFSREDFAAAAAHYELCSKMAPKYAPSYTNLANALLSLHRGMEAITAYEKGLDLEPHAAGVRYNLALAYLRMGRFTEGWAMHESRWMFKELRVPRRKFKQPMWKGNFSLYQKTLLVYSEQGLGDTIQFCRYLRYLWTSGAKIVFEVQERLVRLMKYNFFDVDVYARGAELPHFDVRVPLMSMPWIFGTTLSSIPVSAKYLKAESDYRFPEGMKIGIAWAGNPQYRNDKMRSIPAHHFERFAGIGNVTWVSLQKGKDEDVARLSVSLGLLDVSRDPVDLMETAAVIEALDLVITSDTAVAHLAAAMGKQVWLMLCYLSDYRWMSGKDYSPWYPTMRLFRQTAPGDWPGVFDRVAEALEHVAILRGLMTA